MKKIHQISYAGTRVKNSAWDRGLMVNADAGFVRGFQHRDRNQGSRYHVQIDRTKIRVRFRLNEDIGTEPALPVTTL